MCLLSPVSEAACLLSYDNAAPLDQGDAIGRWSLQGGSKGFATHAGGRLGLSGDRELHIRGGGCQRSEMWGGAFELGLSQRLIAHSDHQTAQHAYFMGPIDLALRASVVSFVSDHNVEARTDLGFQPVLLVSYPIALDSTRQGAITLSAGASIYSSDQRVLVQIQDTLDTKEEKQLSSTWRWSEIIAMNLSLEVINHLPVALELRWQDRGLTAGASVAYQF